MPVPATIYVYPGSPSTTKSCKTAMANDDDVECFEHRTTIAMRQHTLKRNKSLTQRLKNLKVFQRGSADKEWIKGLDSFMAGSTATPRDNSEVSFEDDDSVDSVLGLIELHRATFRPKRAKTLR